MPAEILKEEILQLVDTRQRIEAANADLSGSSFRDVSLAAATFDNIGMAGVTITHADLSRAILSNANLTGVAIVDCDTTGMTIEGIPLSDLIAAYRSRRIVSE